MSRRPKEDDVRNGSGRALYRTWMLSGDRDGADFRFNPRELGPDVIKVRETRCWAPVPVSTTDDCKAMDVAFEAKLATLNDDEREVLRLQGKIKERVHQRITIAAGDLKHYLEDGFTFIPGSEHDVERPGLPTLACVEVSGYVEVEVEELARTEYGVRRDEDGELEEVKRFSYSDIAARMGITKERVHSLVKSAMKKMRRKH